MIRSAARPARRRSSVLPPSAPRSPRVPACAGVAHAGAHTRSRGRRGASATRCWRLPPTRRRRTRRRRRPGTGPRWTAAVLHRARATAPLAARAEAGQSVRNAQSRSVSTDAGQVLLDRLVRAATRLGQCVQRGRRHDVRMSARSPPMRERRGLALGHVRIRGVPLGTMRFSGRCGRQRRLGSHRRTFCRRAAGSEASDDSRIT